VSLAYAFPGQGAQKPGMGQSLCETFPESLAVFEEASEILAFDLKTLCFEGPADKLTSTDITQPAILTTSIATLRALEARGAPAPSVALGHSLGEFSALVAAGSLEFPVALRLVRRRGLLMREAGRETGGAMAAVIGADRLDLPAILNEVAAGRVLVAANFNTPEQVVISGEQGAVSDALEALKTAGARRVIPLEVSGAFHSSLMAPAAERFAVELDAAEIRDARIPVIANATAGPVQAADAIRANLKAQIVSSVLWTDSVARLKSMGCDSVLELGAQNVISGMVRKIDSSLKALAAYDAESVGACLEGLGGSR